MVDKKRKYDVKENWGFARNVFGCAGSSLLCASPL